MIDGSSIPAGDFLFALDLGGTFVFALSGATAAVKHKLDLFGVMVLSFSVADCGGIARDVLIGAVPPAAIRDWPYLLVPVVAGLITFRWYRVINRLSSPVLVFDAVGLALFAVTGAMKALTFHLEPFAAVLLGVLTGIGGGMLRDVLISEVPSVFRSELYAVCALVGASVVVIANMLHLPSAAGAVVGAILCFWLRLMAIKYGWRLPIARFPDEDHKMR
ncbi:MAG: trimeric intracellular cation channel family protein [Acidobacteria bacterium]|nr:MAG: trimeric intracellular cation channel family protein [Acidobacteriota bacterium]